MEGDIMNLKESIRKKVETDPALERLSGIEDVLEFEKFKSGKEPVEGQFMIFYVQCEETVEHNGYKVKVFVKHAELDDFSGKNPFESKNPPELDDWYIEMAYLKE